MVPKATAQLIAQHLARHRNKHLIGAIVGLGVLALLLSLNSNNANATRGNPVAARFQVSTDLPTLKPGDYTAPRDPRWQELTIQTGDNLTSLLQRADLSERDVAQVITDRSTRKRLRTLLPGRKFRVQVEPGDNPRLLGIDYDYSDQQILSVRLNDKGQYYSVMQKPEYEHRMRYASGVVTSSLFESAQQAGLSDNLTMQLADIFGWDIDFAQDIRNGDRFSVLYDVQYHRGEKVADGTILAAEFTSQGRTYRAIRYVDNQGHSHYYTPEGRSLRKAFLRAPVDFRRISSRFGRRFHPIYKRWKRHMGVDYAARSGTPIHATGDGKIIFCGRRGGYGNAIIIRHGSTYSTLYGHMRGFARGMHVGRHVRQGQVIGYVGMTGLATGPHLHYEFRVHGVHRNPLTVHLPQAAPIPTRYRSDFQQLVLTRNSQMDLFKSRDIAMSDLQ